MKSIHIKYILFIFLIAIAGCRKDEKTDGQITIEPTGDPTIEVQSGVTGLVVKSDGTPVANAAVTVYNRQVRTDDNGVFYVNNVGLNKENSHVHVKKAGYFDGFKSFIPALGSKSFVQIQLISKGDPNQFSTNQGGEFEMQGGAQVILPPNGYVYRDGGDVYNGEVNVFTHWYDPTDPDIGDAMPGNLLGITAEGEEAQLGTYGMIAVELESDEGASLQLAKDVKANLIFPVSNELNPPSTIALWSFDELDNVWIQEGEAKLEESVYVAEVSHFSFWNCDAPFPLIQMEGRVLYNGNPVTNMPVKIEVDDLTSGYGYTDSEGYFRGKVPAGEELTLTIRHCNEAIVTSVIGPFDADIDVGNIDVELLNFVTIIQGAMVGCLGAPLPDAYGLLVSNGITRQVITPLADGSFFTTLAGCNNMGYTVQFFDPENLKSTDIIDIDPDFEVIDLMEVRICDDLDEFITYQVNGNTGPLLTEADVYLSNDEKLIIRGFEANNFFRFDMDIFATNTGGFNPSSVSIQGEQGPANPELQMQCGDHVSNAFRCDQFDVNIMSFGEYVSGTFNGVLVANKDSIFSNTLDFEEFPVEGSFRVKIDETITTGEISGQFWFDENGNSTREDDEDRQMETQYVQLNKIAGEGPQLFPTYLPGHNKSYKFTNLLPGTYVVRVYKNSGYELVEKDIGSDDRDNDFGEEGNQNVTDERIIFTNEVLDNVDLGYQLPTSVQCGNLNVTGCAPNIFISTNITGGVPPYTVSLSDGQSMVVDQNPVFKVSSGGVYFMEVEDAVSNMCSAEGSVKDYNNRVNGLVWRDIDGGTPFVFDSGDFRQSGVTLFLRNEDGSSAGGTQSDNNGNYVIENIPPGNYYIEVDVPGTLQVVDEKDDSYNGNSINKDTQRSDVFTIGDCDTYVRINAGLRSN